MTKRASPKTDRPTAKQLQVLAYIVESIETRQVPPTLREIASHVGARWTNQISSHLNALERRGLITRMDIKSRNVLPTERGKQLAGGKATTLPPVTFTVRISLSAPIYERLVELRERGMHGRSVEEVAEWLLREAVGRQYREETSK